MADGGYKIRDQQAVYFVTFAVVGWIDVFTRQIYKDILVDSLAYCQKEKGLMLYSWVIMSNHVHFIAAARPEYALSNILRDFKKYTASEVIQAIVHNRRESRRAWMLPIFRHHGQQNKRNTTYQFWQHDNHPKELNTNAMMDQKLNYIHNNPVVAGIVSRPEDYVYSSARNYTGEQGLLEVTFLE